MESSSYQMPGSEAARLAGECGHLASRPPPPKPASTTHASIYPYRPLNTGDSKSVMLGIQNEREWAAFCTVVLGDQSLATEPRFCNNSLCTENREELQGLICKAFSKLTALEAVTKLDEAGIANANVNDMHGVWDHLQLRARGRWAEVGTPAGSVRALVQPGAVETRMDAVPSVGEHNEAILAELGLG